MSARPKEQSGREWMDELLQAQGSLQFQVAWLMFAIGQLGAMGHVAGGDRVRDLCDQIDVDVDDLVNASAKLEGVIRNMLANARRSS